MPDTDEEVEIAPEEIPVPELLPEIPWPDDPNSVNPPEHPLE